MKNFTSFLLFLFLNIAAISSYGQQQFASESFPNSFNTGFTKPINASFVGSTGTWEAYSNNNLSTVVVNNSFYQSAPNALKLVNYSTTGTGVTSVCTATSPVYNLATNCVANASVSFRLYTMLIHDGNISSVLLLEVTKDNGATWTSIYSKTANDLYDAYGSGTWNTVNVAIPAAYYVAGLKYRFKKLTTGNCANNTYLYIDDAKILTNSCTNLSLGNLVYLDQNGNNLRDASEPGLPGVTVKLYKDDNNDNLADGAAINTTTTNNSGNYSFSGLAAGNYIVGVTISQGYTRGPVTTTDPDNNVDNDNNAVNLIGSSPGGEMRSKAITLSQNAEPTNDGDDYNGNLTLDMALCPAAGTLTLGNLVWLDINANNLKDASEPVIPNATVKLYMDVNNDNIADGAAVATTTTNSNGNYVFTGLQANNYIAGVIIPSGYQARINGTIDPDNNIDNDNNGVTLIGANQPGSEVRSNAITLLQTTEPTTDGDNNNGNLTLDFGLCPLPPNNLVLGNLIFLDLNGNNLRDSNEPGISNATVKLYKDDNNDNLADGAALLTTTTNNSGNYTFSNLYPGNYIVGVIIYAGLTRGPASTTDPDNNVDNDNNGVYLIGPSQGGEMRSPAITLTQFGEPTNDGDDNNANQTLDIGLCPAPSNLVLGNLVWLDINANNLKDANEPVIPNATVKLYADANNDNVADGAAVLTTTTNSNGTYTFTGLPATNFIVGVTIPAGYQARLNGTIDPDNNIDNDNNGVILVGANQPGSEVRSRAITLLQTTEPTNDGDDNNGNLTLDFGLCPIPNNLVLGNLVWLDLNSNSIKDASEPGIANVTVKLYIDANNDNIADGASLASTTTNSSGLYTFTGLAPNNYIVGVIIPFNYTRGPLTTVDPDNNVDNDNNANSLIGTNYPGSEVRSLAITLASFTEPTNDGDDNNGNLTLDIALCPAPTNLTLGNEVWNDRDGDGKRDPGEPSIGGAPISLYRDNNGDNLPDSETPIATTSSDSRGFYQFTGLTPGRYIASMPILPGYSPSGNSSTQATSPFPDNNIDNDNNLVNIVGNILYTNAITLNSGEEPTTDGNGADGNNTFDLAECGNAYIGDFVWNDLNGNGIQDAGEPGINGVPVTITFADGTVVTEETHFYNFDGYYDFENLGGGTYTITFPTPAGLFPSPANQGTNDGLDSDPVNGQVTVTIAPNQSDFTIDAGFTTQQQLGLGNLVFLDLNGNGIRESSEPGMPSTTVNLYKDANGDNVADGAAVNTTTTANDGTYNFTGLTSGNYIVGVVPPSGYGFGAPGNANPNNNVDNDNNGVRVTGTEIRTNFITLAAGTEPTTDGDNNNINSTLDVAMIITDYNCRMSSAITYNQPVY